MYLRIMWRADELQILAENIRRLRELRGISQEKLAQYADVSMRHVSQLENNKVLSPKFGEIQQIARYFGKSVSELLSPNVDKPGDLSLSVGLSDLLSNQISILPQTEPLINDIEIEILKRLPGDYPMEAYRQVLTAIRTVARLYPTEEVKIRIHPEQDKTD